MKKDIIPEEKKKVRVILDVEGFPIKQPKMVVEDMAKEIGEFAQYVIFRSLRRFYNNMEEAKRYKIEVYISERV